MRRSYVVPLRWMVIYEYEVPGGALNLNSTKLPRPWPPWGSSPSRKNPHGRTGNRTRDLKISSQKLWPLDHEAGQSEFNTYSLQQWVKETRRKGENQNCWMLRCIVVVYGTKIVFQGIKKRPDFRMGFNQVPLWRWVSLGTWRVVSFWNGCDASEMCDDRLFYVHSLFNTLTPELNPSAQRCLPRFVTGDFIF
jgi:hypothetical protein